MKIIEERISEYAVLTGIIHEPNQELDIIKNFPAILILPGGGFRICSFREGEPIANAYFAHGYQAFVLRYTLKTDDENATIEAPLSDVDKAISYIRNNSGDLFVEKDKLAMLGFSGGGHLASAYTTHFENKPNALLLGYPGIVHSDLRAMDCPDIIESVDSNTPETFMFGLNGDPITPPKHMLSFATALDNAGVPFEMHMFKGGGHGLSLGTAYTSSGYNDMVNPEYSAWLDMSIAWLNKVFGDFPLTGKNYSDQFK